MEVQVVLHGSRFWRGLRRKAERMGQRRYAIAQLEFCRIKIVNYVLSSRWVLPVARWKSGHVTAALVGAAAGDEGLGDLRHDGGMSRREAGLILCSVSISFGKEDFFGLFAVVAHGMHKF